MNKRPHGYQPRGPQKPPQRDRKRHGEHGGDTDRRTYGEWRSDADEDGPTLIYGVHPAESALRNPGRGVNAIHVTENAENRLAEAIAACKLRCRNVEVKRQTPRDLDRRLGADTVHQGVLLECEPLPEPSFLSLADLPESSGPLVVLDQVTDPHNVGAILRSAAVFGAQAIVMTRRNSPPLGGTLAKSASGALEYVPVIRVPNLARALAELGSLAYRRIGLDGTGEGSVEAETFTGRIALILGSEGRGLRQLTREHCDVLARIEGSSTLASLNVSNAAAVTLHLAAMRRRTAAKA